MADLLHHSVEIILANQHPSGAFVASPNFATYRYCWFRDGAFIAYSMNLVGEHTSAARFHTWAAHAIKRREEVVLRAARKAECCEQILETDVLHTRYDLDGNDASEEWENFQLDGLGSWLWALSRHVSLSNDIALLEQVAESVELTIRYLSALWGLPNYNCWEEHPEDIHPHTLAAIYGGLRAVDELAVQYGVARARVENGLLDRIKSYILSHAVWDGRIVKRFRAPERRETSQLPPDETDASLLGLATPYRVLSADDPTMRRTVERIEEDLHCRDGGVHRYLADTYYGGGEWVLLAAWLGWYYAEAGEIGKAKELLRWVEDQADANGCLPEQISGHLLAPEHCPPWIERWGPVAKPLLWSHAMYLILCRVLESLEGR
jgi:GH15 family glucan-1,4-alpha-glucosidase